MQIAVDVGGTFTDLVVHDRHGGLKGYKSPTTPGDITDGVFAGLELIAKERGTTLRELLSQTRRFGFGTTTATNAILVGRTSRTALVTTRGFRDTLLIREGGKDDSYDIYAKYPAPFIPRELTFEVDERIGSEGETIRALDELAARQVLEAIRAAEVEAIAVSLIWSIANNAHELALERLIKQALPGIPVSLSHQVNPCIREYRRTSATAIDAALKPIVTLSVRRLEERLAGSSFQGTLAYVTSNGGQTSAREIVERPVYLCFSGPSAAPESGRRFSEIEDIGAGNIITADMGGTSFDVSIMTAGRIPMHREGSIAGHVFGVPSVEIHTIGAGGGSIGWVDSGGFVFAGPDSAGSYPGPACYGRGGTRPTITDANLVCGCLGERFSTGGGMTLSRPLAEEAIRAHIAEPLSIPVERAAALMRLDSEQKMVVAIEDLTIKRGIDPREYAMVAGGSAAGMHAVAIAREIGIRQVIVPPMSGVLSAFGILTGNVSFSFTESLFTSTQAFAFSAVNGLLKKLEDEAYAYLERMNIPAARRKLIYTCQACYVGQVWQLSIDLPGSRIGDDHMLEQLVETFHRQHEAIYAVRSEHDAVEISEWGVQAIGLLDDVDIPALSPEGRGQIPTPVTSRDVYLHEIGTKATVPVYRGPLLPIGQSVSGPAVIEDDLTSLLLLPGTSARLTAFGSYIVDIPR